MPTKLIYISVDNIRKNQSPNSKNDHVIAIVEDGVETLCHSLVIKGESKIVYDNDNPINHARVWIETDADLEIDK